MSKSPRPVRLLALIALVLLSAGGCKVVDWTYESGKKAYQRVTMPSLKWAVASILHQDPDVRRKALNVIAFRAAQTGDPKLVDILGSVLNGDPATKGKPDQSQLVRAAAATALGEIREKNIAIPHLLTALGRSDNKPVVQIEVIRALGKLGNGRRDVQDALIAAMKDKNLDAGVSREAAVTLGLVGDEDAIPALIETLAAEKSERLRVALGACDALRRLTGKPFGPEEPGNWELWYAENGNEEIARAYVEGRLELAKLWPQRGPLHQRIPASVTRVFGGIGAEIIAGGKSVVQGAGAVARFPVGLVKLTVVRPLRSAGRAILPRRSGESAGLVGPQGRLTAAPFVEAALNVESVAVTGSSASSRPGGAKSAPEDVSTPTEGAETP